MGNIMKSIRLRAFRIGNNDLTKTKSDLFEILRKKLIGSKAESRRMQLNLEDIKREEDLISDFNESKNFISGVVLRITHSEDVPNIPDDFLQYEKITLNELERIESGTSIIYKEHYYFLVNDEYLITNLQSNLPIKRFQVYINWFLEEERDGKIFEITPIIIPQSETKLSEIKKIIVKDSSVNTTKDQQSAGNKKFILPLRILKDLVSDVKSLDEIIENNIISAELFIKFTKPRKMSEDEYQKLMGAYMKPISETDDVSFATKKNGIIKGSEILKTKVVDIELTETKKINEPHLFLEMEKFLSELSYENND